MSSRTLLCVLALSDHSECFRQHDVRHRFCSTGKFLESIIEGYLSYLIGIGSSKSQIRYHGNTIGVFVSLVAQHKKHDVEYVKTHLSYKKDVIKLDNTSQLEIPKIRGRVPIESGIIGLGRTECELLGS